MNKKILILSVGLLFVLFQENAGAVTSQFRGRGLYDLAEAQRSSNYAKKTPMEQSDKANSETPNRKSILDRIRGILAPRKTAQIGHGYNFPTVKLRPQSVKIPPEEEENDGQNSGDSNNTTALNTQPVEENEPQTTPLNIPENSLPLVPTIGPADILSDQTADSGETKSLNVEPEDMNPPATPGSNDSSQPVTDHHDSNGQAHETLPFVTDNPEFAKPYDPLTTPPNDSNFTGNDAVTSEFNNSRTTDFDRPSAANQLPGPFSLGSVTDSSDTEGDTNLTPRSNQNSDSDNFSTPAPNILGRNSSPASLVGHDTPPPNMDADNNGDGNATAGQDQQPEPDNVDKRSVSSGSFLPPAMPTALDQTQNLPTEHQRSYKKRKTATTKRNIQDQNIETDDWLDVVSKKITVDIQNAMRSGIHRTYPKIFNLLARTYERVLAAHKILRRPAIDESAINELQRQCEELVTDYNKLTSVPNRALSYEIKRALFNQIGALLYLMETYHLQALGMNLPHLTRPDNPIGH